MKRLIALVVLAPVVLFVIEAVTGVVLLPAMAPSNEDGGMSRVVLSITLTALVLAGVAARLAVRGLPRIAILFLLGGVIPANNLVEALFFRLDIPRDVLGALFLQALAVGLLFGLLLDRLAGPPALARGGDDRARSAASWLGRIAACDAIYIVLYMGAGMLVWPFVRHFYEGRVPPTLQVILMQVFRGLVFTGIAFVLARTLALSRVTAAVVVGLTLSLLGGVLPLLVPNPFMPADVRWAHMVEVGVSNFVFGLLAAGLLGPSVGRGPTRIEERTAVWPNPAPPGARERL
jgi:hypothetical protein